MKDYFVPKIFPCPGECFLTTDSLWPYLYAVSIQHCEEGNKREEGGGGADWALNWVRVRI